MWLLLTSPEWLYNLAGCAKLKESQYAQEANVIAPSDNPQYITSHASLVCRGQSLRDLQRHTDIKVWDEYWKSHHFHCMWLSQLLLETKKSIMKNKHSSHDKHCNSTLPTGHSCWAHYLLINMQRGSRIWLMVLVYFHIFISGDLSASFLTSAHRHQWAEGV